MTIASASFGTSSHAFPSLASPSSVSSSVENAPTPLDELPPPLRLPKLSGPPSSSSVLIPVDFSFESRLVTPSEMLLLLNRILATNPDSFFSSLPTPLLIQGGT